MYHQSDLIVNNVSFSSRFDFEYYDYYDSNNNDEETREMKRIKDYLCNSVLNVFTKTNDTIINNEKKEEAIEHVDDDAYNGQILYADMTTVSRVSSSPAEIAIAMAGLRHNHTYLGTGDNLASGSGGLGSYENGIGSVNNENSMIELHPYSYKSKMLKRIQKTRLNIKGENGSISGSSSGGQDALSRANQSRDEQALRDAHIELGIEEVVDSSADEFNELIRVNEFTPEQVNLLKDIRRRGKNKVAAQICRKRKLDSIDSLRAKVDELKSVKSELISEYNAIHDEVRQLKSKKIFIGFLLINYVLILLD